MNSLRTVYRKLVLSKAAFQPELMTVTQQKIVSMCGFLLTHLQSLAESEVIFGFTHIGLNVGVETALGKLTTLHQDNLALI